MGTTSSDIRRGTCKNGSATAHNNSNGGGGNINITIALLVVAIFALHTLKLIQVAQERMPFGRFLCWVVALCLLSTTALLLLSEISVNFTNSP